MTSFSFHRFRPRAIIHPNHIKVIVFSKSRWLSGLKWDSWWPRTPTNEIFCIITKTMNNEIFYPQKNAIIWITNRTRKASTTIQRPTWTGQTMKPRKCCIFEEGKICIRKTDQIEYKMYRFLTFLPLIIAFISISKFSTVKWVSLFYFCVGDFQCPLGPLGSTSDAPINWIMVFFFYNGSKGWITKNSDW